MKALVLRQPWAWLVVNGIKDVENRSWSTKYRGPILVLAGVSTEDLQYVPEAQALAGEVTLPQRFERGGIVGYVTVTGISSPEGHASVWATGPCCWDLDDAHSLPFIPYSGKLGLFEIQGDTVGEVVERLTAQL